MAGNQVTDGDSGVEPQTGPASVEPHAELPDNAAAKDHVDQQVDQDVTADASTKPADSPRKSDTKADSKKSKKDEPQPARAEKAPDVPAADVPASDTTAPDNPPPAPVASEPQSSKPKSLVEVMKVDLRVRRRRRY